jgi:hypothetical protein
MSYVGKFLMAAGRPCTILRATPIESYVSLRRASRSTRRGEAYWEGLILADTNLTSGDILQIGLDKFLVHYTHASSGELAWFGAKANAAVSIYRYAELADENGNIIQDWELVASNVPAYGEIVTASLRAQDPGLLPNTRLLLQIPKSVNAQVMDRIVLGDKKYQLDSLDDVMLQGIARLQLSEDLRP